MMDYLIDHASFEDKEEYIPNYGILKLKRGQYPFGRKAFAKKIFASEQEIRTRINVLRKTGFLTTESTNKITIITICNYDIYNPLTESNQPPKKPKVNQQLTNSQPQTNKLKELKELKEIYKWLDIDLWKDFRIHRQKIRVPLSPRAESTILNKLEPFSGNGKNPNKYIEEAIEKGWRSVFPKEEHEEQSSFRPFKETVY